jgi:hypothetical protein
MWTIARLLRDEPARLRALNLSLALSLEELRAIESKPPDYRQRFTAVRLRRAIIDRLISNDLALLAIIEEEGE